MCVDRQGLLSPRRQHRTRSRFGAGSSSSQHFLPEPGGTGLEQFGVLNGGRRQCPTISQTGRECAHQIIGIHEVANEHLSGLSHVATVKPPEPATCVPDPQGDLPAGWGVVHRANQEIEVHRAGGCHYCYHTGYRGRRSIYEILNISQTIRRKIVDGGSDSALKQQAVKEGMRTLRTSALEEVRRSVTTIDEVMRVVDLKSE